MKTKNIFLTVGAVLLIDFIIAKCNNKPRIVYKNKLSFNYNALTIPPFGIYIQNDDKNNNVLLQHELVHWEQYRKTGVILYYLRYGLEKMFFGYDKMPMEIQARKAVGETENCINNYTECVRNGTSKTVKDENFRIKNT